MSQETQVALPIVLVVDDQAVNRKMLEMQLSRNGYDVVQAANGREAVEMAKTFVPDLILLDVMMPVMDGFETCKALKKIEVVEEIPVIFLTARERETDIVHGLEAGGVDYVIKPFNAAELLARLKVHLELKDTRERLRQTNEDLIESNRSQSRLLSILANDMRTYLSEAVGALESLAEKIDESVSSSILEDDEFSQLANAVDQKLSYLSAFLDNITNWGRMKMDEITLDAKSFLIKDVVDESLAALSGVATAKGIKMAARIPPDLNAYADEEMIGTVVRNLISNAIKFTPRGGRIMISEEHDGYSVTVYIRDSGVGISKSFISKVFSMDEVTATPGTDSEQGTGIGLALCESFIRKNRGEISVQSELGKGSTFAFKLPRTLNTQFFEEKGRPSLPGSRSKVDWME